MKKSIRYATAIFIIAIFVIVSLVVYSQRSQPEKIIIAQFGDLLLYLPLYIAQYEGLFDKYGLDVEIVSTGGDEKTYAAVLSGSVHFGVADPTFVAIAGERGQKGSVIALLINGVPNYGVAISPGVPIIQSPGDLANRTVATVPAPSTSYALVKRLYESANLTPSIYQVAPSGLVPSLQAERADYALLIEPWVSQVVQDQDGFIGFSLMDYYPNFALTGVTTSEEVIQECTDCAADLIAALTEAVNLFYEDEEASLRAARAHFPNESINVLKQGIKRLREDRIYPDCLAMTESAWVPAIRLRREVGDLQFEPGPMMDFVNNSFALQNCPSIDE